MPVLQPSAMQRVSVHCVGCVGNISLLFTASGSASGNGVAEGPAGGAGAAETAEVAATTARRWTIASSVSVDGAIVTGQSPLSSER